MSLSQLQPNIDYEEKAIDRLIIYENFNRTKNLSLILFFLNVIYLFIDYNNKTIGLWARDIAYLNIFYTHVVLGLVTLLFFLISYRAIARCANDIKLFHKLYVVFFIFFTLNYSAVISGWISQEINRPSSVYIIACFTISIMISLKPKVLALLYGSSCITFMILLTISQENPNMSFGHYIDVLLLVVISYFLSTLLYKFKRESLQHEYYLEHLVTERTEELQAANDSLTREMAERKRTEMEMVKLDRLNLIGEMAASISHEVRNPMTTVKGFLQFLYKKQELKDKEYFDIMIRELDSANSILSEFLSISKNKPTILEYHNINDIVTSILPLIQADAQNNDKLLTAELNNVPDLQLDSQEIRQLLLNLVRNGFEAMSSGGQLKIRTFSSDNKVTLVVSDEGNGFEQCILEKLGTPFITTKEQGTGLGLAVCYGIVSRHNGSMSVETGPTGSSFYVSFGLGKLNKGLEET